MINLFKAKAGNTEQNDAKENQGNRIYQIHPKLIATNPNQPRCEFDEGAIVGLADSISKYGFIQPLSVRISEAGAYELIAGERRLRAALMLNLSHVPCVIVEADRARSAEIALVENIQRVDLNFFEQALAIEALIKSCRYTQNEAAERLSMSQSALANKLRLLRLNKMQRRRILDNSLTERHARSFLKLDDDKRELAIDYCIAYKLNVGETELLCDYINNHGTQAEELDTLCKSFRYGVHDSVPSNEAKAKCDKKGKREGNHVKIAIKDAGILINSFNRLAELAESTGACVEKRVDSCDNRLEFTMIITNAR